MTTATLSIAPASTVPATAVGRAAGWLVVRQIRRGALIVILVCAGMSALVAAQYRMALQGSIDDSGMRALAENPAIRILFGPPVALDDAGGFTVWRTGTPLLVLACVWILLAATRITRGEEEAGRHDLLLAGRVRVVDFVVRCIAAVAGSALLIGAAVGVSLVAARTDVTGAALYAGAVLGVVLTYGSAGMLAAQVMPTRSAAVSVTVGALVGGLMLRMLADASPALAWTAWTTPFGLTARAAPYVDNRVTPLIVLAGFPVVLTAAALIAARRRDVGSGLIAVRTRRSPRTRFLGSIGGFVVRRAMWPTFAWAVGIAAYFVLVGTLIASVLEFFEKNPFFAGAAASAGFGGLSSADGFAAALFGLLAIPSGLYGVTRLAAMVTDERARRWTPLFSTPVSRIRLAWTEVAVTTVGVLTLHATAAFAIWIGAALTDAPLDIADAVGGAVNTAPIAWLAVAAAALAAGWLPSAVGVIGALPVAGGFLLDVIAKSIQAPIWIADLSPFAHIAAVPAAAPDWPGVAELVTIGAILAALGVARYARRDLTS